MSRALTTTTLTLTVLCFLLTCAVKYVPLTASGGYQEAKIADDSYVVKFIGNQYNNMDQVRTYVAFRSAEIALENGYSHFLIEEDASLMETRSELSSADLSIETTSSMSGGVRTEVRSNFGPEVSVDDVVGIFTIKLMKKEHPVHKSASVDAENFIEQNRHLVKR
ncbi:MAG: hypothetical protein K9M49_09310 [Candidatus Marinimicrobia bacterium]|nr:hypothetical protein [Candidatus Neomarinimicrobiota bacterium]MCF7851241.1 hypothetical protein [Candidatus Neomarinimicrobiota bacterium]MCF7905333.1 hypothetical protein [Candidatus Neomarinimicrobiota bacterium]